MVEFRQLQFFLSLSETGNFARAAEREHITQSALSQQIARLERELSVQLFERSSRGTSLTAAGEDLLIHAQGVLQRVAELRSRAASLAKGMDGSLRIGSPTYAVRSRARQHIVGGFLGAHPDVELEFSNEWSPELLRRVTTGDLDLSFVMLGPDTPDLDLLVVQDSAAVAIVREDDELADRAVVSLADLADRRVLVYPKTLNAWLYDQMAPLLSQAGAHVAGLVESSLPAVLEQVRAGHGLFPGVPWEMDFVNPDMLDGLALVPTTGEPGLRYRLWLAKRSADSAPLVQAFWLEGQRFAGLDTAPQEDIRSAT